MRSETHHPLVDVDGAGQSHAYAETGTPGCRRGIDSALDHFRHACQDCFRGFILLVGQFIAPQRFSGEVQHQEVNALAADVNADETIALGIDRQPNRFSPSFCRLCPFFANELTIQEVARGVGDGTPGEVCHQL